MVSRIRAIAELVRLSLLIVCFVLTLAPIFSLHAFASDVPGGSIGDVTLEHRLTAMEVSLANTNELMRGAFVGVCGLVLEMAGRYFKAFGRSEED